MKKFYILFFLLSFSFHFAFSQEFAGKQAEDLIPGTKYLLMNPATGIPEFIKFNDQVNIPVDGFKSWMVTTFKLDFRYEFRLYKQTSDELGFTHYKYKEYFAGFPLDRTTYIVHVKNGRIVSMNGTAYNNVETNINYSLTEITALKNAMKNIGAELYEWQIPAEEDFIKKEENNPNATYFPKGELVLVNADGKSPKQRIAFKFNIYAHQPLSRAWYWVDAISGEVIYKEDIIHTVDKKGTAYTKYSGTQTMTTDSFMNSRFRMRETGRGNGIETYNMLKGTNYGSAVDFIDTNNIWNQFNTDMDEAATDCSLGCRNDL